MAMVAMISFNATAAHHLCYRSDCICTRRAPGIKGIGMPIGPMPIGPIPGMCMGPMPIGGPMPMCIPSPIPIAGYGPMGPWYG